jgi:hypothetical protein
MSDRERSFYHYPQAEAYDLFRDGKFIMSGTEQECWGYLHRNISTSVDHALRHEGYYRMTPATLPAFLKGA